MSRVGAPRVARVTVVVGNPKPRSRTRAAAVALAAHLGEVVDVLDLAELGPALLDWSSAEVAGAVERVQAADVVVVASPTYKGTYTGLLKLFLDRFPTTGLEGVVAVPLLLGAGPQHAQAPASLAAVLTEIGADVVTRGLYVLDSAVTAATTDPSVPDGTDGTDPRWRTDPTALAGWLATQAPVVARLAAGAPTPQEVPA